MTAIALSKKPKLLEAGHSDHFQTPPEALTPLLPYIKKEWTIWEPACGKGNLTSALRYMGYRCFGTDIAAVGGFHHDFLSEKLPVAGGQVSDFDAILTNPAYSKKDEFLERCYQLGKPFALLLPLTVFDSIRRRNLFQKHGVECIFLPNRISFETPNHEKNVAAGKKTSSWFATLWITWGLNIGKQLVFTDV
jgi:hypothetical protein